MGVGTKKRMVNKHMKFYYLDGGRKKYLTLKRGSAAWANADCPNIFIEGDSSRWPGWRLMTGTTLEDGNNDLREVARTFVKLSGEAFYKKFPKCAPDVPGANGFLANFERGLK